MVIEPTTTMGSNAFWERCSLFLCPYAKGRNTFILRLSSKGLATRDSRSELHSPLTARSFLARSEKTNQKRGLRLRIGPVWLLEGIKMRE